MVTSYRRITDHRVVLGLQSGFTLVELMVSLSLGLLISAAAAQLLLTSQTSLNLQKASAELQDSGDFGLKYIVRDIQLANLGAATAVATDSTLYGGIVLSQSNMPAGLVLADTFRTTGGDEAGVSGDEAGVSNSTDLKSDQLTIQYKAVQPDADCTGAAITQADVDAGTYIIQRYFLRVDSNGSNEPNRPLVLACSSAHYKESDTALVWKDSQIIVRRVDHFHVLLGVASGTDMNNLTAMRYMTIKNYKALSGTKPRIISVQLGFIVRSYESVGNNSVVNNTPTLSLLDQSVTLKNDNNATQKKFIRESIVQTVALRNGQGVDTR